MLGQELGLGAKSSAAQEGGAALALGKRGPGSARGRKAPWCGHPSVLAALALCA